VVPCCPPSALLGPPMPRGQLRPRSPGPHPPPPHIAGPRTLPWPPCARASLPPSYGHSPSGTSLPTLLRHSYAACARPTGQAPLTARVREGWRPRAWFGLVASVAAPERAAAEPFTSCWWPRAQVSRDAPPPLPGGYMQGGRESVLHGGEPYLSERQQARARPAGRGDEARQRNCDATKGKGLSVRFPGNMGNVNCYLATVRRLSAASAASPRLRPTHA